MTAEPPTPFTLAELNSAPSLRSPLQPVPLDQNTVLLVGDGEHHVINDKAAALVVSLMNGARSAFEIITAAAPAVTDLEVLRALAALDARDLLKKAPGGLPDATDALLRRSGIPPERFVRYAADRPVSLLRLSDEPSTRLVREALLRFGLRIEGEDTRNRLPPYQVVVVDSFFNPALRDIHRRNRADGIPWCFVELAGSAPFVSPPFGLGPGPCFACLAFWIGLNRPVETYLGRRRLSPPTAARPVLEPAARILAELVAVTAARMICNPPRTRQNASISLVDLSSMTVSRHPVRRRPQCPTCGEPLMMARQGESPIVLGAARRGPWEDGGYRMHSPAETHDRLVSLVSPFTGAVSHLSPMPGRHAGPRPVYLSGYRVVPLGERIDAASFQRVCAGKGRSADQARMSALGEAVERFSSVYQGDEASVWASQRELGAPAVSPNALLNFSERQYRERDLEALTKAPFRPPLRSCPDTRMTWTPAWSLGLDRRLYLPLSYCYAETPPELGASHCPYTGNGAAAGACLEEALLQGLFELVERDATAVWWYNRIPRPGLDLASFDDPYVSALEAEYHRHGLRLWVLDLTGDLGVPVYAALSYNPSPLRFSIGLGCHLNARVALSRALTELNQVFDPAGELRPPWDTEGLGEAEFLFPAGSCEAPADPPAGDKVDLRTDIDVCIQRLRDAGLELIAVNKTRPDIGLCVVHVVVPGLRHFRPCFAPGRLYTVPVSMGWRTSELDEADLNPVPLLL